MSFFTSFSQIAVLFLVVFVGFGYRKTDLLDAPFCKRLSAIVMHVTTPCLILASALQGEPVSGERLAMLLGYGFLAYASVVLLSAPLAALLRTDPKERGLYRFKETREETRDFSRGRNRA